MIPWLLQRMMFCLAGASVLALVACGQAGPLYLPGKSPQKINQFKKAEHRAEYGKEGPPTTAQSAPAASAPPAAAPAPVTAPSPSQDTSPPAAPPATPPPTP